MAPVTRAVTAVALVAVTPGMLVIVLVAVITGGAQFNAIELAGMADVTAYGAVGAGQLEFRILVMIEEEFFPFSFVMALFALVAIAPGVHVIDAVTGHAFRRQILVTLIGVTAVAGRLFVFAV